jgi:MarR family transcriptional regulator, transcriptional regulator for hemolysin
MVGYGLFMKKLPRRSTPDLTGMLDTAAHLLNQRLNDELGEIGITLRMQCVMLHALEGDRSQREIAHLARIDKTTMVATVDQLELAGYVERHPSPTDRRARIIAVTAEGAGVAAAGQKIVDRVHRESLKACTGSDQDQLLDTLDRLLGYLATAPSPPEGTSVRRRRHAAH